MSSEIAIVEIVMPVSGVLRVKDLPEGSCYMKEHRLWIKQESGYSLALDNFVRYQVRPTEQVERRFSKIQIKVES